MEAFHFLRSQQLQVWLTFSFDSDLATMTVDRIVVVVMVLLLIAETVDPLPDIRNLMFDAFPSFSRCNTAVEPRMPFSTSGSINQ